MPFIWDHSFTAGDGAQGADCVGASSGSDWGRTRTMAACRFDFGWWLNTSSKIG